MKRTATVSVIAAIFSVSVSTGIRIILGVHSDTITVIMRLVLPFVVAIPIGLIWFSKLERLEMTYRALVRQANELARTASTDPLTGVLNRRSFIEQFDHAMEIGINGWFLVADIDYLKLINDTYGHLIGDAAVLATAKALDEVLPHDSLIARVGGDEFCAFVPALPRDEMLALIQHVSEAAESNFKATVKADDTVLSISVGKIACKSKRTFEDVVREADAKLYRKKRMRELPE